MSEKFTQALVRGGRTLGAALIATAITTLPQIVGVFEIDPAYTTAIILGLTAVLNTVGKLLRSESIEVTDATAARAAVANTPGVENANSAPVPF